MIPNLRTLSISIGMLMTIVPFADAQTESASNSIAFEADAISYFIGGYSGIVNVSLANGFQIALGSGRYEVPSFLLKGDAAYGQAQWKATSTSVQVLRVGYRLNGPGKNGPALAAVVLNQNWRLRSEPLAGETRFRPLSVGISGGYYVHLGEHFYVYPTLAYTHNQVISGTTSVKSANYKVERFAPNGSIHAGWEWSR